MFNREPDCENCQIEKRNVGLRKDNETAFKIYQLVSSQVIPGFDGAIDLNLNTVIKVMELLQVPEEEKEELLRQVLNTWRFLYMRKKEQKENKK